MQEQQHAGLPRALDVQRFAGAREQEIRALCASLKESRLGSKFGVAALPRHLRRRAGSHKPFHGHRLRPNLKLQGKRRKLNPQADDAAGAGEAAEAGAAAGQQQEAEPQAEGASAALAARPFTNRRMRRAPAALQQQHRESAAWTEASLAAIAEAAASSSSSPDDGSTSGGVRRLETHVWHAKRLAMEHRYAWLLPAGAAGQGRGSRSFVHTTKASCLMHDASYLCPLLLRGPWDGIYGVLAALLDPEEAAVLSDSWRGGGAISSSGSGPLGWELEVMLHHAGQCPRGAICPAQLLLCGPSQADTAGSSGMEVEGAGRSVQACLWVHPAAAAEAHAALRQAAAQRPDVSLSVLNMRRLELRGGIANTALAVALAGATASGIGTSSQAGSKRQQQQQEKQEKQEPEGLPPPPLPLALAGLQHGDAVQLQLPDPRLCKPVSLGSAAASLLQPTGTASEQRQPFNLHLLQRAQLPLSEAELSGRRQQLRRRMLQLEDAPGSSGGQEGEELQRRGYCPAVLVRHEPDTQQGMPGWSLVLPAGWVPPFWLAAAYAGCKPAGQREWRWLHTLEERRCFPWDHPDTAAYAALMAAQQLQRQLAAARRPKAKQMLAAPAAPPPWEQLLRQGGVGLAAAGADAAAAAGDAGGEQEQQAAAMDVDAGEATVAAAAAAWPPGQLFVARSYATMTAALQGGRSDAGHSSDLESGGDDALDRSHPVASALRQGLLQWRPKQPARTAAGATPGDGSSSTAACCLLEASVQPIKTGTAAEGAAICFISGQEAQRHRTPVDVLSARQQRRRQRELAEAQAALAAEGGDPAEAVPSGGSSGRAEVAEADVHIIGYVLSEAPRGAPRRSGSLAAVAAAPAWRLRALQHWGPRQDGGAIEAFVRGPGSATLHPVRLQLLVEQ